MREWLSGRLPAFRSRVGALVTSAARWIGRNVAELVATGGGYLVAEGVGDVYGPAGTVTGGVLLVLGALAIKRSAGV